MAYYGNDIKAQPFQAGLTLAENAVQLSAVLVALTRDPAARVLTAAPGVVLTALGGDTELVVVKMKDLLNLQ